jgi:DNA-3-methyladenine glycosylase
VRAAQPIAGLDFLRQNRRLRPDAPVYQVTNGPGKLCQALRIDLAYNGKDFFQNDFKLVDLGRSYHDRDIAASPRIGISKAKDEKLRFTIKSSPWLSRRA